MACRTRRLFPGPEAEASGNPVKLLGHNSVSRLVTASSRRVDTLCLRCRGQDPGVLKEKGFPQNANSYLVKYPQLPKIKKELRLVAARRNSGPSSESQCPIFV